LSLYCS